MRYLEEELVAIAKRENNVKRNYLVVNRLQGKHIPVKPEKALEMFDSLAEIVLQKMRKKKILVIGSSSMDLQKRRQRLEVKWR